eukprot:5100198-Ditylum_brightwellii.AAC.1
MNFIKVIAVIDMKCGAEEKVILGQGKHCMSYRIAHGIGTPTKISFDSGSYLLKFKSTYHFPGILSQKQATSKLYFHKSNL